MQWDKDRNCGLNCDTHGNIYDFMLSAIGKEPSARKIIRPFRVDLIEKFHIKKGDIVVGRPMGAGGPVTHVLQVYEVDELAGILYTWAVGPKFARNKEVINIKAYAMVGFEGIAEHIKVHPKVGKTAGFIESDAHLPYYETVEGFAQWFVRYVKLNKGERDE